jgi:hypothetical protein
MKETFGDRFWQWDAAYASGIDANRVRYLQDAGGNTVVPVYRNCVRIEVVDLFSNWNRKTGMVPRDTRGASAAHFAPVFAAAQDPGWVWAMDGEKVPYALAGGLELNVPGYDSWANLPLVDRVGREAFLSGYWYDCRYLSAALPSLRE